MFREMRRNSQALDRATCEKILAAADTGILTVHGEDGYPYPVPVNFALQDDTIYIHCAKEGHKIDAIRADDRVGFCVMGRIR